MPDTYTPNLNLKKPGYDSPADIKDLNDNFDKIDTSVNQLSQHITNVDSNKLGKTEQAADSAKLGGKAPEYYAKAGDVEYDKIAVTADSSVLTVASIQIYRVGKVGMCTLTINIESDIAPYAQTLFGTFDLPAGCKGMAESNMVCSPSGNMNILVKTEDGRGIVRLNNSSLSYPKGWYNGSCMLVFYL